MQKPIAVVKTVYEAFGRADVPTILSLIAPEVDWEFVCPPRVPYSGRRTNRPAVQQFFADIGRSEDVIVLEPLEFIEAGEHVTVLGFKRARAKDTGKVYETQWAHVVTVRDGKIVRCRGFYDTAARFI
jgi:ketosteroid isomerase-like protein